MDAKAFLKQVRLCDMHINEKIAELENLKELTLKITTTWKSDVVSSSGSQDKLGEAVARIVDLEEEINRAVDTYVDKKSEVSKVVEQVNDPDQVAVLYKRYFRHETWEQIACEMHMTFRNVCYIHGRALRAVEYLLLKKELSNADNHQR